MKSAHKHKGIFVKGIYTEVMGANGETDHSFKSNIAAHDDLRRAFNALVPHCINLAEQHGLSGRVPDDKIDVQGFTISGEDENEGVTLSFTRTLSNGAEISLNTPFQKWDDQIVPYMQADDLSLLIEACKAEVYSYIFEDKHQPNNQLELFATTDEV